jgi:hypothetical protein
MGIEDAAWLAMDSRSRGRYPSRGVSRGWKMRSLLYTFRRKLLPISFLQNCERINLCFLKSLSLWWFVTAAMGNQFRLLGLVLQENILEHVSWCICVPRTKCKVTRFCHSWYDPSSSSVSVLVALHFHCHYLVFPGNRGSIGAWTQDLALSR